MSRIYTRTGDDGTTGLGDGGRVAKLDPRVETFGSVDETNSAIGLVLSEGSASARLNDILTRVQHELFEAGAELASPEYRGIAARHVERLEADIDALDAELPRLREFILPGGSRAAAACHLARAVCRRAERDAWRLAAEQPISADLTRYLNRLSDFLFVAARTLAREHGGTEILWHPDR